MPCEVEELISPSPEPFSCEVLNVTIGVFAKLAERVGRGRDAASGERDGGGPSPKAGTEYREEMY